MESRRKPRQYGFSCTGCRQRKIRCDGVKPKCGNCIRSNLDFCSYSQISAERQLQLAKEQIRDLEAQLKASNLSRTEPVDSTARANNQYPSPNHHLSPEEAAQEAAQEEDKFFWSQVSIDNSNSPAYHGSTSRFYDQNTTTEKQDHVAHHRKPMEEDRQTLFRSNAELLRRVWEPLALAKVGQYCVGCEEMGPVLLEFYFRWQHPLHNCLYRPCFYRDLALDGPYFSPFLLMSIFALAARHVEDSNPHFSVLRRGESFLERAKALFIDELAESKPKIPTIQALLILGGRQCAIGKNSEGWLYTGMAIRMLKDIGLHLNTQKLQDLEGFDHVDLEVRKRLYLSAYIWDKSISICLGRPPTLTEIPFEIDEMYDYHDDMDTWKPELLDGEGTMLYPDVECYNTTTFRHFCHFGKIISYMYDKIYASPPNKEIGKELLDLETRMYQWHDLVPSGLKIDDLKDRNFCPPPHILSLNILYHTVFILIYRPFLRAYQNSALQRHAQTMCSNHSTIINDLFTLYIRTFGYRNMTYLVSYCIYTAATVNVYEIKLSDKAISQAAAVKLSNSLRLLESEVKQTPGISRSISIIKDQLRTWDGDKVDSDAQEENLNRTYYETPELSSGHPHLAQSAQNIPWLLDPAIQDPISDYDFMDIGGGFQPSSFHWTLDNTWDINSYSAL